MSRRRNSAVGALPMATTAPAMRAPHSSTAAALRVSPICFASAATDGSPSVQITSLSSRQARARHALGHHFRIAKDRGAIEERAARQLRGAGREDNVGGDLDHAAGMDDAHRDDLFRLREARKIGLGPDRRKGAAVDFGAVADVVEAALLFCVHRRSPPSSSMRDAIAASSSAAAAASRFCAKLWSKAVPSTTRS